MKAVELISIPVSDQENAKNFYVQKLGFNLVFEGSTPEGGKWIQIGLPGDSVTFSLVTGLAHANPGSLKGIIISTDDIKTDVSKLRKKGIIASDIGDFPHGKISSFSDPDGNQWVLRQ